MSPDHAPTLAERIAEFAAATRDTELPPAVAESVRQRILDTIGICLAASTLDTSRAARAWAADEGGSPRAAAIGVPNRLPARSAAFVNGVLAHSLDYDDTHLPSVLHPSASIIPAALAAGQAAGASGRMVCAAIAVGLEVCVRLGMAGFDETVGNSTFFEFGQHATSICGAMGAAVSAAMLQGMDEAGIVNSLGVAASMASGIIESNRTGGTVKRLHCGWAAQAGISAAELVRYGFTGPPTVLEGRFGFFQAWLHGSKINVDAVTDGLATTWLVPGIFFKPYPANHFTHAGIDAAIRLRQRGLRPENISRIELRVPAAVHRTIGAPIDIKRQPETGYMAQFSGPYTVIAGLLGGSGLGVGLDDFTDELATDPYRRRLMALVDVVPDDRCSAIFPYQFPAIVTVETLDGRSMTEEVLTNRGGPDRPLTFDELSVKFSDNAARQLPSEEIAALREGIAQVDQLTDISDLIDGLRLIDPHRPPGTGTA
ncbi:MAG: MmgE/PrpD family protein [Nakamurella sp.]